MFDTLSVSDVLGYTSIACWLGAQFPQVVENIKRKSCEGLALPFLANWLLGDISNLVGCILTHQLPFQTYLATYFVCVDCMLVAQYYYYYKPPKGPPSALGNIRSASTPAGVRRRMSVDRGASRYRALSVAASNVAAAAALAAQQDEQNDHRASFHYSARLGRQHTFPGSNNASQTPDRDEEDEGDDIVPAGMLESFRSERGRGEHGSKQVSWTIERPSMGRAASVGPSSMRRKLVSPPTTATQHAPDAAIPFPQSADALLESSMHSELSEPASPIISNRGSRASRKGSTMVFLGVWALFGIGSLTHRSSTTTNVGHVLSSTNLHVQNSISLALADRHSFALRDLSDDADESLFSFGFGSAHTTSESDGDDHPTDPNEEPSSQQVLGRIFAWLCTTLYLTSRLPQIWKNYARKSVEGLSMYLFIFAFLGNCFYVSSILTSPRRFLPPPEASKFIKESIPYLLGSAGTLIFDMTIVAQSFCYKPRHKRHSSTHARVFDEEEAGLLSGDVLSTHPEASITNRGRSSRTSG